MEHPVYLNFEECLSEEQVTELLKLLDIDNSTSIESHVFDRVKQINVVNKHLRSSEKIEYRDT